MLWADPTDAGGDVGGEKLGDGIIELAIELDRQDTVALLGSVFSDFLDRQGFAHALVMKLPEAGDQMSDCVLSNSFPQAWSEHYDREGFIACDPVIAMAAHRSTLFSWSRACKSAPDSPLLQRLKRDFRELGLGDGIAIPIHSTNGSSAMVSIAAEAALRSPRLDAALCLASEHFHSRLSALHRKELRSLNQLTDRELECLDWAGAGKSDWEIGQILSISAKTANYHIENAKRKFGVSTRIQAVVAARRFPRTPPGSK